MYRDFGNNGIEITQQNIIIIAILIALVGVGSLAYYLIKRAKDKKANSNIDESSQKRQQ